MGVATKNRRKLKYNERLFVWFVAPDKDSYEMVLHVISDDKRFIAHYMLGQYGDRIFITILGPDFAGAKTGQNWKRFRCPHFDQSAVVTPSAVVRLIDWCLTSTEPREAVSWDGARLS